MSSDHPLLPLKQYVHQLCAMDDAQWAQLIPLVTMKDYKRKEYFQREGRTCDWVGFIVQGCFRSVKEQNGEERTFDFAVENEFVTDYYAILQQTPSVFDIIAVEDTLVAVMPAQPLLQLFNSHPAWQQFGRRVAENTCCYYQQRLLSAFFDTPLQRYRHLLNTWPDVVLRIPQHIIANYLGVTKETLSRIRRKMQS